MERELENPGDPFSPSIRSDGTLFQIRAPWWGVWNASHGGYGAHAHGMGRERALEGGLNALHMGCVCGLDSHF